MSQTKRPHGVPISLIAKVDDASSRDDDHRSFSGVDVEDIHYSGNSVLISDHFTVRQEPSEFELDHVYGSDDEPQHIVFKSLLPQIKGFTEGYSVSLILIGSSKSRKSQTVEDLLPVIIQVAVERLQQKYPEAQSGRGGRNQARFSISFSAFEIVDEKIQDLLNADNQDIGIKNTEESDFCLENITEKDRLVDLHDIRDLLGDSFAMRTNKMLDFGDARKYAHTGWIFDLKQTIPEDGHAITIKSRMLILEIAGTEKLSEDSSLLRTKEGPSLNKSLLCLQSVGNSLVSPDSGIFAPYESSKLTKILKNSLCRNSITIFLALLRQCEPENSVTTLELGALFYGVETYPVKQDDRLQGLLQSYRAEIIRFEEELASSFNTRGNRKDQFSTDSDSNYLVQLNKLEGKLVKDNLEKLKIIDEKEKLYEKLVEFKQRFNEVVEQKAAVQKSLLEAEDEKLKISKALLDLKIENNQLVEQQENEKYELTTKILNTENEVMQLQLKEENREKNAALLRKELEEHRGSRQELEKDLLILKRNFDKVDEQYKNELLKNEELGVELLTLVNQKNALIAETTALGKERDSFANEANKLNEKYSQLLQQKQSLEESLRVEALKADTLTSERMKLELELQRTRVEYENRKLELEKRTADYRRERDSEVLSIKNSKENELKRALAQKDALFVQVEDIKTALRKSERKTVELESNLAEKSLEMMNLTKENALLTEQVKTAKERFREKLIALMKTDANNSNGVVDPDDIEREKIQSELVESLTKGEKESQIKLESLRKSNFQLVSKNRALLDRYRSVKYDLEDINPEAAEKYKDDEDIYKADTSENEIRLEREISSLQQKIEYLQNDLAEAQEKNIILIDQHRRTLKEQQNRNAELESEVKMLEKQKLNLEDENQALSQRSGIDRSDTRSAKQLQEFQASLVEQLEELKEATKRTQSLSSNNADVINENLKSENRKLQEKIRELENTSSNENAVSEELLRLREENKQLKTNRNTRRSSILSVEPENASRVGELLTRCTVAEEELKNYKTQMKTTITKYQKQIKQLKKDRDSWKSKAMG